jgi:type IV fimbrial biogenesis protein FimT
MTERCTKSGFTVVELLVTIAVAAVLIGIGVPAFNEFVRQQALTTAVNDFVVALSYARSEAIRQGTAVSVQAADASAGGNEWGAGYCVVVGTPGDCSAPVLRRFEPLDNATLNGVGGFNGVGTLTFNARGLLTLGAGGSVELCSTNESVTRGRVVNITLTGRTDVDEFGCHS